MRPASGEIDLALEILDAVDLRWLWRREAAGRHDVIAARYGSAIVRRQPPAFRGLIPIRPCDLRAETDIAPQIVAVGDEAEIAQDLGLGRVFLRPGPGGLEVRIEGVAVVDGLDLATRAAIAIPVPGDADVISL